MCALVYNRLSTDETIVTRGEMGHAYRRYRMRRRAELCEVADHALSIGVRRGDVMGMMICGSEGYERDIADIAQDWAVRGLDVREIVRMIAYGRVAALRYAVGAGRIPERR